MLQRIIRHQASVLAVKKHNSTEPDKVNHCATIREMKSNRLHIDISYHMVYHIDNYRILTGAINMLNALSHYYSRAAKRTLCLLITCVAALANATQSPYEIYVFYNKYCGHCKTWMNTTGTTYDADAPKFLGENIPKLSKYDLSERRNMTLYRELLSAGKLSNPIDGVPAFVIVDENQIEIGRTIGAMDTNDFYKFVNQTIKNVN